MVRPGSFGHSRLRSRSSPSQVEQATAPPSDQFRYVLKWDSNTREYSTVDCNPIYSDGRVTQAHLSQLLDEMRKSQYYKVGGWNMVSIVSCAVVVLMMIVIVCLNLFVRGLGASLAYISIALFVVAVGSICFSSHYTNKQNQKRLDDLRTIITNVNNILFLPMQARCQLSPYGTYITIWFDWKSQQPPIQPGQNFNQAPPMMIIGDRAQAYHPLPPGMVPQQYVQANPGTTENIPGFGKAPPI